jgi:hypothetical protein
LLAHTVTGAQHRLPLACCRYATLSAPVLADPILYGDYGNILECLDNAEPPPRLYQDMGNYSTIQKLFESLLIAYNVKHKPMQLVFFDDALEHLTRIIRTLRLPMVCHAWHMRAVRGFLVVLIVAATKLDAKARVDPLIECYKHD